MVLRNCCGQRDKHPVINLKDVEMGFDLSGRREGHPLGRVALEDEGTQPLYMFSRVLSVPEPTGSEWCSPPDVKT